MTDPLDLAHLRALADAANRPEPSSVTSQSSFDEEPGLTPERREWEEALLDFHNACDPAVALALLDRLATAEAQAERFRVAWAANRAVVLALYKQPPGLAARDWVAIRAAVALDPTPAPEKET